MFPQPLSAWLANQLHNLVCKVCNPLVKHRRRQYAADAQAGGDMSYFRNLINADKAHQADRLDALREALGREGAAPWEADLLVDLVDQYRQGRRELVMAMPPQHGPGLSPAVAAAGLRFLDEAEANVITITPEQIEAQYDEARRRLPVMLTADEYAARKAAGTIDPDQLYAITSGPADSKCGLVDFDEATGTFTDGDDR